ncbi:helicase-related protein [Klebsiella pneumoniae]|uniref:helicase-related protein n=4 Tax=Klebsiella pneumoniae TaxID=573 RepID=UPI002380DD59|nr:helicase-related protein [Klebsiella pneumoniae]MDE4768570.1 helicase-related protein [Klebsiella pneumoniae]
MSQSQPRLKTSAMIASIADEGQATVPAPFGVALSKLAAQRPEIVGMTADLSKYTDLHIFAQAFPDRFFQMGMAEQLLMAAAGGMAKEGFIPFATTYAAFATRRAYDFIHQVIAEEHLNVKICAALPGLTTGYGPSHQATEDLAIMRGIPGMVIVDPCDALEIEQAVPAIADHQGPVYMRLLRGKVPLVLDKYDYQFELGKAKLLEDGNDVLIISSGLMTMRALADFKSGGIRVLVATDIAARGLDIEELPHVVNYELPNVPEDYVHRIGRTGRAAATGEALSLVCVDEHKLLRDIERLLKKEIPRIAIAGYEPDPSIKAEPIQNGRQQRGGGRGQGQGRGGQGQGRSGQPRSQNNAPRRQDGEAPKARTQDGKPPRRRRPRKPAGE